MTSNHHFYDITLTIWHPIHCICVMTSTVLISHQMYLWDLIHYIWRHHMHCKRHHIHYICNITATVSVSSHPHFWWYHFCMFDITPTIYITLYTLHKASHPHLWHHTTLFMTSHSLYSWHHSHDIWHCIHRICVITTTLLMISDQLFLWHHTYFMYDILCTIHIITSTLYELTPL